MSKYRYEIWSGGQASEFFTSLKAAKEQLAKLKHMQINAYIRDAKTGREYE